MKSGFNKKIIISLPNGPGVYLFYGTEEMLFYIGKSKNIRARVRAHFAARDERWLMRRIRRIEVQETAGELGALLHESQLIKELRPMYNVMSRQRRRIIIARRVDNKAGYATVRLEAVDHIDLKYDSPILGIFKHKTQAKEFLSTVAKTHRLCPKLLRLENSRGYCFSYHLGQCDGACMGEEDVTSYNMRVETAFEARRIIAWPFDGAVIVEEISKDRKLQEIFVIDNWCLIESFKRDGRTEKESYPKLTSGFLQKKLEQKPFRDGERNEYYFDYDSYKILYSYLMEGESKDVIKSVSRKLPWSLSTKTDH